MLFDFLAAALTWQEAVPVVLGLILIEGLLSVDNALAIAAMASHLDEKRRKIAMNIGYAGAYGFRILALFIANHIVNNHWLMLLGSLYLVWLMCAHFSQEDTEVAAEMGEAANVSHHSFAGTIAMIAFLDLSLSFDNVVAAVALARDNIMLVYVGVTIGIITLRLVAGYCIKLLEKHPWLEHTAFLLVGFVGILLSLELFWDGYIKQAVSLGPLEIISDKSGHFHIEKVVKFTGILGILGAHIAFENIPAFKTLLKPALRLFLFPMELVAGTFGGIFLALTWPFRLAWRKLRASS